MMNKKGMKPIWVLAVLLLVLLTLAIFYRPLAWGGETLRGLGEINLCEQTNGICYPDNTCGGHGMKGLQTKGTDNKLTKCPEDLPYCCRVDYNTFEDGSMYLELGTEPKSTFQLKHDNPGPSGTKDSLSGQFMDYESVTVENRQYAQAENGIPKNAQFQLRYRAGSDAAFCLVKLSEGGTELFKSDVSACRSLSESNGFVEFFPAPKTHFGLQAQGYTCGKRKQDRCTITIEILGGSDQDPATFKPIGQPFYIVLSGEEA